MRRTLSKISQGVVNRSVYHFLYYARSRPTPHSGYQWVLDRLSFCGYVRVDIFVRDKLKNDYTCAKKSSCRYKI